MNPVERLIESFQELAAQVPEILQPIIVMIAAAIPFVEGEGGAVIGVLGGLHPILAGVAAATGNFLSVLLVVTVTSRTRTAVVDRRHSLVEVGGGAARPSVTQQAPRQSTVAKPESKRRQRFNRWLLRYGVPGASILGPLAVPTQITSAVLVGGGTPRRWVLLWQAVAIAIWTTVATVSAWAALTFVVES